ncbi:MAG: ion transporter [Paludibacteraceae bacterium]|nr:ion transporter [Paludibacteraceae bacterium]
MKHIFLNERVMMAIIIINTISLFISGFWPGSSIFEWADCFFTLIFVIEAAVKLKHFGIRGYFRDGWNIFDFIILVFALPSLSYPFVNATVGSSALLAFRSLRVLKTFRLFHFIPNIGKLLNGLKTAIRSSFLITVAYLVFLLVFSIMSSSLFGRYSAEYFGDPFTSIFSTFQLFTIEGWYEIPNAIAKTGGPMVGTLARIYFSVLLFHGGIMGMSLVNSIFVDAMAADNNDEVLEKLEQLERKLDALQKQQDKEQ